MNATKLLIAGFAASLFAAPLVSTAGNDHRTSSGVAQDTAPVLPLTQAMALAEAYSGGKVVAIEGRGYDSTQADVAEFWRVRVAKPDGSASRLVIDGRSGELVRDDNARDRDARRRHGRDN